MRKTVFGTIGVLTLAVTAGHAGERNWEGKAFASQHTIGCYTWRSLGEAFDLWNEGRFKTAITTRGCSLLAKNQQGEIVRGDKSEEAHGLARFLPDDGYGPHLLVVRQDFEPR